MEELTTRKRIYEEIVMNPGLHFRELQRRLKMQVGMLEYHLSVLQKEGLIIAKQDGKYVRYFANTVMTQQERNIIGNLRNGVMRRIVIFVLERERVKHRDITEHLNMSSSTISYHLNKLVKNGILNRENVGRENYYTVNNPKLVANTLIKYRKSFLDSLVDSFAKLWLEKNKKGGGGASA